MKNKLAIGCLALAALFASCESDDDTTTAISVEAGELSGGPFTFFVDGNVDNVSGVTLDGEIEGANTTFVVTDDSKNILGLPPSLTALEGVNFDDAGVGACYIYHLAYEDGLDGLSAGENLDDFEGTFDLSNFLIVNRNAGPEAGELAGGPFTFFVDGMVDNVSGITLNGNVQGANTTYIVTDDNKNILGLPPTLDALEGVNFDDAGVGACYIYHLSYENGLSGLEGGENLDNFQGVFDLSNFIIVNRNAGPQAAEIVGGPFVICVDDTPSMVSGLSLEGDSVGSENTWVITTDTGEILGLPPTLEAVEGVNFDDAGPGVCLIWYLRYEPGLEGLEMGANANDLSGVFDLSEPVSVTRNQPQAAEIVGGPFTFTVDGTPDMVSGLSLEGESNGEFNTWVITTDTGEILGLPPTLEAVEGVNFDDAGVGVCLIWYLRYEEGLQGLAVGENANDFEGCYDLSEPVTVTRN